MTTTTISPEVLAANHGIPARNAAGDPLTTCRNHPGRVIYAVAALGADRDLCADCRPSPDPAPHGERGEIPPAPVVPTSVSDAPGRHASGEVTMAQIGQGVLMSCGARSFVKDDPNGLLMFAVGPAGRKKLRKVLVRLMPNDTYAVEYGTTSTDPFADDFYEWRVVEQAFDVYAENLAAVVRRLGDRERY